MATRHYSKHQGWITATVELEISKEDKENGENRGRDHKNLKAKMQDEPRDHWISLHFLCHYWESFLSSDF